MEETRLSSEEIMDVFCKAPGFAMHNGVRLTKIAPGYAECEMEITEKHLNFGGTLHGAAVYTIMDVAAGGAFMAYNKSCVALSSNVSYISTVSEGCILAKSREISHTKRTSIMDVEVYEKGSDKLIAKGTVTLYTSSRFKTFDERKKELSK